MQSTMAVKSQCSMDGIGDALSCYKPSETIKIAPEPPGMPSLTACLYDDSDSEDCEPPGFGPMEGLSFIDLATAVPVSPIDEIPNPQESLLNKRI